MTNDPVLVQLVLDGERLARLVGGRSPRMELVTMNTGKVLASVPMTETTPDAVRAATRALVASQPRPDGPKERAAKRAAARLKLAKAHGITIEREHDFDKSSVVYDILRHNKIVGYIRADRQQTSHAIKGESTYATGSWTVEFTDERGRAIVDEDFDFEVDVVGFRSAKDWRGYATAGRSQDVLAALQEAKGIAIDWLVAHPDYQ
jgi:hypothetical protein